MASTDDSGENNFCDEYLLLKPEEASFFDLFRLLFSSDQLEKGKFIDCPQGYDLKNFRRRWLIFVSIVAQKLLLLVRRPLAIVGNVVETWLNLLSENGGFFKLLVNLFTGRLVWPDKTSARFRSILGQIDRRIDLDDNIKPDDTKYKAMLTMMASKFSYENEAFIQTNITEHWKMKFLKFYNFWNDYQQRYSTQGFILQDTQANPNMTVVAFRGTEPFAADDWQADVDISWYKLKNVGKAHRGFMKALGLQKEGWPKEITDQHEFAYYTMREKLKEILKTNDEAKFIVTGHSLGGALAILFPFVLVLHEEEWLLNQLEAVYTFGQPRVGDEEFGEFMKENLSKYDVKYF
ncbi:Lipase, class 3, partial [Corchorus capsularis]